MLRSRHTTRNVSLYMNELYFLIYLILLYMLISITKQELRIERIQENMTIVGRENVTIFSQENVTIVSQENVTLVGRENVTIVSTEETIQNECILGSQSNVTIICPQPVVIGQPMTVTCSVASIGGRSKMDGLQETGIRKIQMFVKPDKNWELLAFYEKVGKVGNETIFQGSVDTIVLPHITTRDFELKGGNADEFSIRMTVTAACHFLIPYRCSFFHYSTNEYTLKLQNFDANPVALEDDKTDLVVTVSPVANVYFEGKHITVTCLLNNHKENSSKIVWEASNCRSPYDFKSITGLHSKERTVYYPDDCSFDLISQLDITVSETYCWLMCTVKDRSEVVHFPITSQIYKIIIIIALLMVPSSVGVSILWIKQTKCALPWRKTSVTETRETNTGSKTDSSSHKSGTIEKISSVLSKSCSKSNHSSLSRVAETLEDSELSEVNIFD